MYKLKFTILQLKMLRFLSIKFGKSFNARNLAKHLDVSQTAISKSLPLLEKERLIKREKDEESGRWAIELNRENSKIIEYKRVENLRLIYESGLGDYLKEKFPQAAIILFGPYSKGVDTLQSSLNIAIVNSKERKVDLKEFNNNLERNIVLSFYDSFKYMNNSLKSEILSGIILSGGIEL